MIVPGGGDSLNSDRRFKTIINSIKVARSTIPTSKPLEVSLNHSCEKKFISSILAVKKIARKKMIFSTMGFLIA
jgi:hypothetical protein